MKITSRRKILVALMVMFISTAIHAQNKKPAKKEKALISDSESKVAKQDLVLIAGLQSTYDLTFKPCRTGDNYEECVRIANKKVVLVTVASSEKTGFNQLIFAPQAKGETTVNVRDEEGNLKLVLNVVVNESNLKRRAQELHDLLRDVEGIEIKIVADKIVVDGEVVVINDLNRLYAVLSDTSYKDIVMNLVTVSPIGRQLVGQKIAQEINNPAVRVRIMNDFYVLEGEVESKSVADEAFRTAMNVIQAYVSPTYSYMGAINPIEVKKPVIKEPIINKLTFKPPPKDKSKEDKMIRIVVSFVELSKDYARNFGFSWMPSLAGGADGSGGSMSFGQSTTGGVTSSGNGSISGTIGNLFPKLATAQQAGYARVLDESIVLVKSGKEVQVAKTIEIPYPTTKVEQATGAASTTYGVKDVGPQFKLTPIFNQDTNNIEFTKIEYMHKALVGTSPTGPLMANQSVKIESIIIKNNESAAIANSISNNIATSFNKDPPGGKPANPLFTLLRSKAFTKAKSQFVIFITPQVIESASESTEDIKQRYGFKRKTASVENSESKQE